MTALEQQEPLFPQGSDFFEPYFTHVCTPNSAVGLSEMVQHSIASMVCHDNYFI